MHVCVGFNFDANGKTGIAFCNYLDCGIVIVSNNGYDTIVLEWTTPRL